MLVVSGPEVEEKMHGCQGHYKGRAEQKMGVKEKCHSHGQEYPVDYSSCGHNPPVTEKNQDRQQNPQSIVEALSDVQKKDRREGDIG